MIVDAFQTAPAGRSGRQVADATIAGIDGCSIDFVLLAPAPEDAAVDNERGNTAVLEAAAAAPSRIAALISVNPWRGGAALDEVDRCADAGAKGLALNPLLYGLSLVDERVLALAARAVGCGLPMYVHTGKPPYAEPLQLAGLASRYPNGVFIMGHAGSTDYKRDVLPAMRRARNVYVETSWCSPLFLVEMAEVITAERMMFGSDFPLGDLALEYSNQTLAELTEPDRSAIFGETAARVFRLAR